MTLILSYISHEYVLQISDQLLVVRRGGAWIALRDPAVKCVLADGRAVFASTGLARLPRSPAAQAGRNLPPAEVPANEWLAEVLALPNDPREVPQRLRDEIVQSYAQLRGVPDALKQQALVGVAWVNIDSAPLEPVLLKITNMNRAGQFEQSGVRLAPDALAHIDSTRPLDGPRFIPVRRRLEQCAKRRLGPKPVARTLIDVARAIAAADETVGEDLILSCLPKNQVELGLQGKPWVLEQGEPSLRGVTFQHIAAGTKAGHSYSPALVLGGLVAGQMQMEGGLNIQQTGPTDDQVS